MIGYSPRQASAGGGGPRAAAGPSLGGPRTVVLLVDELDGWNGSEVHLFRLLQHLDPTRIRAIVGVIGCSSLDREFRAHGIPFYALEIYRTFAPAGVIGVGKIASLLRRKRASLLVTYHAAADIQGPLAAALLGVPVLSCRRDDGFTKKPVHTHVQRALNPILRGMIAVSHSVAAAVERRERYPRQRIQVIWNGEDLTLFSPGRSRLRAELGLKPDACVVTSISSLLPVKDHGTQLAAFARLLEEQPHRDLRLLVVGSGPEAAGLRQRTAPLGDRVRFLGQRSDIPEVLRASDIFLQTSLTEGFSNSILQAMATALPVVVTRVGGNPELVGDGCGYIVEAKDSAGVAAALGRLAVEPQLRLEMGRRARSRVERCCSLRVMVDSYMDAFERAIAGGFPGPSSGEEAGRRDPEGDKPGAS